MALPALIGGWVFSSFAVGMGALIARALVALGIGYATYSFVMPGFVSQISSWVGGVPPEVRGVLGLMKVDVFITMIFSAITAKMSMRLIWRRV